MKRLFALILVVCSVGFAASWDGTKGSLTIATNGDAATTVISVTSATSELALFQVSVIWLPYGATLNTTSVKLIARPLSLRTPSGAMLAVFDIPESRVKGVSVSEFAVQESQLFLDAPAQPVR